MKKGFTLIELLCVIVIIAVVSVIIFPNISNVISSSRKELHDEQIMDIQKAAQKWATDNMDKLDKYHLNITYVGLNTLQQMGYLEKDKIYDPLNRDEMTGCIEIKYETAGQKYNYVYQEKQCQAYAEAEHKEKLGYVIYSYDTKSKTIIKDENSKEYEPIGLSIYNYYVQNNLLRVDGETTDGLYELENEYVFRGVNPNNYVELQGVDTEGNPINTTFRILSIDKKDYSLKLIDPKPVSNYWDQNGKVDFKSATSNTEILLLKDYGSEKVANYDFKTGVVDGNEYSVRALLSLLENDKTNLKVGLPSIIDYNNASASALCSSNYLSSSCKENNYLTSLLNNNSMWTINNNGSQVWYVDANGDLKLDNSNSIKQLYPVIKLNSNVYITNPSVAVGSSSSPYIIK